MDTSWSQPRSSWSSLIKSPVELVIILRHGTQVVDSNLVPWGIHRRWYSRGNVSGGEYPRVVREGRNSGRGGTP